MTNYVVPSNEDREIMVGWDPQMNTYFAHVIDTTKNEDEEGRDILWVGCTPNEIHDIDVLRRLLVPYVHFSKGLIAKLYGDPHR